MTKRIKAAQEATDAVKAELAPIPMRIPCPDCWQLHIDEGEFATKPHHTHACQHCGHVWRPAVVHTVGVRFLPGDVIAEARGEKAEPASPSPPGGQGQELCREHGACVHPNGHWWPCNDEPESRPVLLGELVAALRSRDIFDLNAIADELERKR
jgi:hypothetical protein